MKPEAVSQVIDWSLAQESQLNAEFVPFTMGKLPAAEDAASLAGVTLASAILAVVTAIG
jgi:hypothetical protein